MIRGKLEQYYRHGSLVKRHKSAGDDSDVHRHSLEDNGSEAAGDDERLRRVRRVRAAFARGGILHFQEFGRRYRKRNIAPK